MIPNSWFSDGHTGVYVEDNDSEVVLWKSLLVDISHAVITVWQYERFRSHLLERNGLLKADHPLFDWLINCVILNHF